MQKNTLKGKRIELIRCNDQFSKLKPGMLGTVEFEDDFGTVHVKWDDGSYLGLCKDDGDRWNLLP